MKTKKYFIVPFLALLAAGCQDEERTTIQPATGEEVKFGVTLDQSTTRTIYGDDNGKGFPIYWVDGDEVIVSSPDCAKAGGVGSATYRVKVESETQNYATSLDKTGEIGVRWGENTTGTFYSVYPASGATLDENSNITTLELPRMLECDVVEGADGKQAMKLNMDACLMYAKTENVASGQSVNLKYIPLSTALRFTLQGPSKENAEPVTITGIGLRTPRTIPLSGRFNVDFSTETEDQLPTMTSIDLANYVQIYIVDPETGGGLVLKKGEKAEMNIFFMLTEKTKITDDWLLVVNTDNGAFTKRLGADADTTDDQLTLVPGKIHTLKRDLLPLDGDGWEASEWMTNISRNVYLSEISIPGSWNSMNSDSQTNTNIDDQYNAGVRAFHLDTRWKTTDGYYSLYYNSVGELGVADGSRARDHGAFDPAKLMNLNAPTFAESLGQIVNLVQPDEYLVVICTFAQSSYDHDRGNGGWEKAISDICEKYNNIIDASTLTSNSVVADVLGQVIVIVNTSNTPNISGSKCLFMDMGMTLGDDFPKKDYYEMDLKNGTNTPIGIKMFGTHAQISRVNLNDRWDTDRGYAPTLKERMAMGGRILEWAAKNYKNIDEYNHDAWIYLGLGGYVGNNNYDDVATQLNDWISGRITAMENDGYHPVGIVLMNNATEPENAAVAKEILQLNNKYRKAFDPDRSPIDGKDTGSGSSSTMQSAAPGYSSGMTDNQTDAIGWTRSR